MTALNAIVSFDESENTIICRGVWTVAHVHALNAQLKKIRKSKQSSASIDASNIERLDSAGALLLNDLVVMLKLTEEAVNLTGLKTQQQALYTAVSSKLSEAKEAVLPKKHNPFYNFGVWSVEKYHQLLAFITFTGELSSLFMRSLIHLPSFAWRELISVMEETGYRALGIIALMSFLIGIVLAYQLAIQLQQYGADIFIVDTTGVAILREFAPLITAVIMAGRTSTAFAALIGTMKVNEEIDALRTMGVQPIQRLVLPRIAALILTLPLLVVWADLFGMFGAMVLAKSVLNIGYVSFLQRLDVSVGMSHYVLGLIKTPVFALVIAGVGCFQGFCVGSSADSVGRQTTKAAVQSIFLIIIVDALFSIIYSWMGV